MISLLIVPFVNVNAKTLNDMYKELENLKNQKRIADNNKKMTEQEIITALYMICPDSLYKRYKREKGYISVWYSLPNDTETDKHHLELLPDNVYIFDNGIEQELTDGDAFFRYHQLTVAKGYSYLWKGNPFII